MCKRGARKKDCQAAKDVRALVHMVVVWLDAVYAQSEEWDDEEEAKDDSNDL